MYITDNKVMFINTLNYEAQFSWYKPYESQ